jgi:hypothetical protein
VRLALVSIAVSTTLFAAGCTHYGRSGGLRVDDVDACAVLDSALSTGGLRGGLVMRGKTTIDVNQYRVRGRFTLTLTPAGDLTFEMTSTSLLGGHREDAVLSFYADTLRVLDRERGRYYEGAEVDALVADGTDTRLDLAGLLRLVTGRTPACDRLAEVRRPHGKDGTLDGSLEGRHFALEFEPAGLSEARWPLPLEDRGRDDTLEASYTWRDGRLRRFVVFVPERRWRIKLAAEQPVAD